MPSFRKRYRPAPRRCLFFQPLEPRQMLSAMEFVQQSVDLYTRSRNPIDLGQPVVPLYCDYNAWGAYMSSAWSGNVTWDANDPNVDAVSGGTSSWRMTVNDPVSDGWLQFNLEAERPRSIPEFGEAHELRILARSDRIGQQLKITVTGDLPGDRSEISWVQTLATAWAPYVFALPDGLHPSDIDAVQFVLPHGSSQEYDTVRLDEVRLGVDGVDPLRLAQSYRPGGWVPRNPPPEERSTADRDLNVYPKSSFLYDQALAIKALLAAGRVQTAREVADAVLATGVGNGSYFNERAAGHALRGDGTARGPLSSLQTLGDNAWFGLALIDLYRMLKDSDTAAASDYLDHARGISDWAEMHLKDTGPLRGYRGGYDEDGLDYSWRSVENNISYYQFSQLLAAECAALGDPDAAAYAARAVHAGDFVMAMYDAVAGKFWTGTTSGDIINTASVPLDAQLWSILTLAASPDYASAIDWSRPLAWAENHLWTVDDIYAGFTFSSGSTPNIVWFEGTAHAAVLSHALGDQTKYEDLIETLDQARDGHPNGDGVGLVAASHDGLADPEFYYTCYDARLHVGTTAWYYFAQLQINPFAPIDVTPPQADLIHPAPGSVTNENLGYVDVRWYDLGEPPSGIRQSTIDGGDVTIRSGPKLLTILQVEYQGDGVFRYFYDGSLADGTVQISFVPGQVADLAGNTNSLEIEEFSFDSTPPRVTVDRLLTSDQQPPLSGAVDDRAATIQVTVDGNTYIAVNQGDGTWTLADDTIEPALANGVYEVVAVAVDAVGNAGQDTSSWELAIGPPPFQNPNNPFDVNNDGYISPIDALLVINYLLRHPGDFTPPPPSQIRPPYYDVSGDNYVSPIDALRVINRLQGEGGEGEGDIAPTGVMAMTMPPLRMVCDTPRDVRRARDLLFAKFDDDWDDWGAEQHGTAG